MSGKTNRVEFEMAHIIMGLASLKSVKQAAGWKPREELMLQS